MLALLTLLGCAGNIHALYDSAREDALRPAGAAPSGWTPDIRVRMRPDELSDIAAAALDAGMLSWKKPYELNGPLGLTVTITPTAAVEALRITLGDGCQDCLSVTGSVSGAARWRAGERRGQVPFTARIAADVEVALEDTGEGFQLRGKVRDITRLRLSSSGTVLRPSPDDSLGQWARTALQAAPVFTLAELGGEGLPLRAATLRLDGNAIAIDALSDVDGAPVRAARGDLPEGTDWEVRVSEETVSAMIRRAAFEAGTVDYDIAIDPRSVDMDGERFTMDLRLWRLAGRGWWRDYSVEGSLSVRRRKLVLSADEATEGEKSPGAGLADPLALLAERRILEAITDNLQQAVPGTRATSAGALQLTAATRSFYGEAAAVVLQGTLDTVASDATDP